MAQTKYLDLLGLQTLVAEIKAGDAAALKSAKDFVGAIPADATQTTVIAYLEQKIADAKAEATFDGKASSVTVEDANNKFTATTVEGALAEVKDIADANATAVATLTGGEGVTGSVSKALKDAKDYADGLDKAMKTYVDNHDAAVMAIISNEQGTLTDLTTDAKTTIVAAINEVDAHADAAQSAANAAQTAADNAQSDVDDLADLVGFTPEEGEGKPQTVKAYIDAEVAGAAGDASKVASDLAAEIERATQAESGLQEAINAHKELVDAKVTTLIGDDANKSVRTIANEELAAQLIPEGAKESLDTLQEIAAWIQAHPDDASAMNKAIEDLGTLVGTIPEDATAKTIVGLINELVKAEEDRATGIEEGLDERIETLEGYFTGEEGTVAEQIATAKSEAIATAGTNADSKISTAIQGLVYNTAADGDYVKSITEANGVIAPVYGTFNFDEAGAAAAVQGDTTKTVKDLEDALADIVAIPTDDITKLFHPTEG